VIGRTIGGKYSIVRQLGEGGMGAVYEARHTGTGRRVAVKVITGELARDPKLVARFEREARAAGAIESEHIAQVLDVGQDGEGGAPFLAMEFLEGEDVQQLLERLGPVPADLALRIGVQACLGLEKAHEQGIVHRDIKPANLFLAKRDGGELRVKVLDFGIAKVSANELDASEKKAPLTRMGMLLGSPLYMSPEQARGNKELDHRTDIWSLGIVLYQALTGRTPLQHVASVGDFIMAVCSLPVTPMRTYGAWVDPEVANAVERALALDPRERYQTAAEMREALSAFLPQGASIRASMLVSAARPLAAETLAATPIGVTSLPAATPAPAPTGTAEMSASAAANLAMALAAERPTTTQAPVAGPILGAAPGPALITPLPPARPAARGPSGGLIAGLLAVVALGGLGAAYGLGWIGGKPAAPEKVVATAEAPKATGTPSPALTGLLGQWWGDGGQIYDAVRFGEAVSFKLKDPEHLAAQGYLAGDPHFIVRALDGEVAAFRVEERARPLPPKGFTYDLVHAHASCVAPWVDLGGKQLRAELQGDRLLVKLARLDAPAALFTREGLRVTGCSGLADAHAVELDVVLSREPVAAPAPTPQKWVPPVDAGAHDAGHDAGGPAPIDAGAHVDAGGPPPVDAGEPAGPQGPVGASCASDAQCRTRTCVAGICRLRGGRRGGPCATDDQCSSHRCLGSVCR
jgi:serine/threonine-protein kinase